MNLKKLRKQLTSRKSERAFAKAQKEIREFDEKLKTFRPTRKDLREIDDHMPI